MPAFPLAADGWPCRPPRHPAHRLALLAPAVALLLTLPVPSLLAEPGLDLAGIDATVAPGDDFFAYTNGTWVKAAEIPADRTSWGSFALLREEADRRTAELISGAAGSSDGDARRIADYYAAFIDEARIESLGTQPIAAELAAIRAIADRTALARLLGDQLRADVDPLNNTDFDTDRLFGLWVSPDFDQPERNAAYLLQGGLGMPDRDLYLATDERSTKLQDAYRRHIAAMLTLAGLADADAAAAQAATVHALEAKIAAAHATRTESYDLPTGDHNWARTDFATKAPGLDWTAFFTAAGLDAQPDLRVWQPAAIRGLAALVASEPLAAWRTYLAFHLVDRAAPLLPARFVDQHFAFHGRAVTGAEALRERPKRAVDATNEALGEAVGKLYVARYFPPAAKAEAERMVRGIIAAFERRIDRLEWMTPATRARAKAKLGTLYVGVGYPERWQSYDGLEVRRDDAYGNAVRAERFAYRAALARLAQPADKTQWWMTPQTVNAVNLPLQNAMNFPAAILAPPFFDAQTDPAQNYGGIGTVIGHEISHSFDDQGAQFDEQGRRANWWTAEDLAHFQALGDRLVAQYDAYEPLPGLHVNGRLTLSENIADVAGVAAAYDAYRTLYDGAQGPAAQGFSGDQRFFVSFGQIWRVKTREETLRNRILTDGHTPGPYRAATARNLDAWYEAFAVEPGQRQYLAPAQRVQIW